MCKQVSIICGDMRMVYLSYLMSKENTVATYGYEQLENSVLKSADFNTDNITKLRNIKEVINKSEIIIAPIPFSNNEENLYLKLSKDKISIRDFICYSKGKTIIAGAVLAKEYKIAKENNVKIIDVMNNESLTVLNTIATAEGAVEVAIKRTKKIIHGSKVLILGFGRVGKIVAKKFAGLSADITCAVRKEEAFAWVEACGYKSTNINTLGDNLGEYDIIINTPPTLILDKNRLLKIKKDCLVIDLASRPGGVDRKVIEDLGINFEWALALPGKIAPQTSAEYIKRVIDIVLKEEK